MGKWDEVWAVLAPNGEDGVFFEILLDEREADMEEGCCEELAVVSEELAGEMAGMTIGVNEDEVAKAQETMHQIRVLKAQRKEEMEVVEAKRRRLKFVLSEYDYD